MIVATMTKGRLKKQMMYGPSFPINKTDKKNDKIEKMNSMVDLVRVLKEIEESPENINAHKDGVIGEYSGRRIKLSSGSDKDARQG